jgi:hypothetical protein
MTKYWTTTTTRDAQPVTLYVETSDSAVEHDLEQAPSGSLIHAVIVGAVPTDPIQQHYALAAGAFHIHCRAPGLTQHGKIAETDAIPKGLEGFWTGGSLTPPQTCAAVVYEQPNA